ncbi:diguanylate cyclase [Pseudomonas sp. LPB0260]|uniref:GGDEF domain-containing protein n=1 Tax=Pseudomonas sp. LPB0260 TaxID=2614442 RepID=UPI0015C23773|nr:GGDEF domain-containing protein [Pseudomonas sp. LPB0260]QLC72985.1 diguanylate cyclase [Pseudomonas sp. LPB0260]QLC75759.1 diguanylate cyclase [Pseudomonas sp. LPB0260]
MSDDAQRWKDKYLASLEQQEKLERRWDARLDLMRRGLVRSSLAAEGADKAVDQCMQDLREILRRDDIDVGLAALVPRLERAVLDSEKQRQQRIAQVAGALAGLVEPLLELDLPREVHKPLKRFAKGLDARVGQMRELPVLLAELAQLQQRALAERSQGQPARPGLLQRWFGGRDGSEPLAPGAAPGAAAAAPALEAPATRQAPPQALPPGAAALAPAAAVASSAQADAAPMAERTPGLPPLDSLPAPADLLPGAQAVEPEPEPEAEQLADAGLVEPAPSEPVADVEYALPAPPEPGYSAIAERVEASLLGLLDELPLPERHQAQADLLRERIRAGLNLYELVPVLDDLAVLMLAIADVGQRDFEVYLKQLNERLATFQGSLQDAHEDYAESLSVVRGLDSELRQQVDGLHSSVRQATDLGSLKELVESRLNGLLDTMQQYQRQRDERDQQVGGRLQTLVERVAHMEEEAKGFRQHLEEQRQKALLDPLTGLPNRAAWGERLDLELARWQRYGGDLLLAIVDIDHFKGINDAYGHLAGDKVLKIIAQELRKRLRKIDFIARFGGEEFVLLLPSTPLDGGLQLLETLREGIQGCPFHFRGERVGITLSAGISAFAEGERSDQVLERADQALYRAKRGGRNRIERG